MIPNIVRGDRMAGLMVYLVGPGRANEHTEPHLVAGDSAVMAWYSETALERGDALAIAKHLDRPRVAYNVEVPQGHVWHCSLSLPAQDGALSDTQWQAVAERFMKEMGFFDDGKAPVRWAAVRHGVSKAGNDHVHLAVQWVREDGTKCFIRNDFAKAQQVAKVLENDPDLGLKPRGSELYAERGYNPAERPAAARAAAKVVAEDQGISWDSLSAEDRRTRIAREMAPTEPRVALALRVRAAATAAENEAEFVRRLRRDGLIVRPRFAEGTTDVIAGYSVAVRPASGERAIWYGGGTLANDLTLPRLRQTWPDSPQAATGAAAEWSAAARRRPPVAPGRETAAVTAEDWTRASHRLAALHDQLVSTPVEDTAEWARVARQLSGSLGAWAQRVEPGKGPLTDAAIALGRCAQVRRSVPPRPSSPNVSMASVAAALIGATRGGVGPAAKVALVLQMMRLATKVYQAHQAHEDLRRSQAVAAAYRERLAPLAARLQAADAAAPRQPLVPWQGSAPTGPGAPIAQPLTPYRPPVQVAGTRPRGIER